MPSLLSAAFGVVASGVFTAKRIVSANPAADLFLGFFPSRDFA